MVGACNREQPLRHFPHSCLQVAALFIRTHKEIWSHPRSSVDVGTLKIMLEWVWGALTGVWSGFSLGWRTSGHGCRTWERPGVERWQTLRPHWSTAAKPCATCWSARTTASGRPPRSMSSICKWSSDAQPAHILNLTCCFRCCVTLMYVLVRCFLQCPHAGPFRLRHQDIQQSDMWWHRALTSLQSCAGCAPA